MPAGGAAVAGRPKRALRLVVADGLMLALVVAGALLHWLSLLFIGAAFGIATRVGAVVAGFRGPFQSIRVSRTVLICFALVFVEDSLAIGVKSSLVEAFKIPAGSMVPTVLVGDHVFADKRARQPKRGDLMVFLYPREPDKTFIKRVVAVGGDTVEVRNDVLWVNGREIARRPADPDCHYEDFEEVSGRWERRACDAFDETLDGRTYRVIYDRPNAPQSMPAVTVPPGGYFVMGDNRDNSHDSRYWGTVPQDHVLGVVSWVWWSSGQDGVRWDRLGRRLD